MIAIAVAAWRFCATARKQRVVDQTAFIHLAELGWVATVDPLLEARILSQQLSDQNKSLHGVDAERSGCSDHGHGCRRDQQAQRSRDWDPHATRFAKEAVTSCN